MYFSLHKFMELVKAPLEADCSLWIIIKDGRNSEQLSFLACCQIKWILKNYLVISCELKIIDYTKIIDFSNKILKPLFLSKRKRRRMRLHITLRGFQTLFAEHLRCCGVIYGTPWKFDSLYYRSELATVFLEESTGMSYVFVDPTGRVAFV
jgi:hypothetical protein